MQSARLHCMAKGEKLQPGSRFPCPFAKRPLQGAGCCEGSRRRGRWTLPRQGGRILLDISIDDPYVSSSNIVEAEARASVK